VTVREATPADWPAIWRFMRVIVAAGETFSWDRDIAEADARAIWMGELPKRTFVAVDDDDRVLGSAVMGPNHGGPASHVATASFMVDPAAAGRGAGRALGERVLDQARTDGYRAIQFNAGRREQYARRRPLALPRLRGAGHRPGGVRPPDRRPGRAPHHASPALGRPIAARWGVGHLADRASAIWHSAGETWLCVQDRPSY